METTCHASYPLNSENASPFGTFTVYLSCAAKAQPPRAARIPGMATIVTTLLPFIASASLINVCHRGNQIHRTMEYFFDNADWSSGDTTKVLGALGSSEISGKV